MARNAASSVSSTSKSISLLWPRGLATKKDIDIRWAACDDLCRRQGYRRQWSTNADEQWRRLASVGSPRAIQPRAARRGVSLCGAHPRCWTVHAPFPKCRHSVTSRGAAQRRGAGSRGVAWRGVAWRGVACATCSGTRARRQRGVMPRTRTLQPWMREGQVARRRDRLRVHPYLTGTREASTASRLHCIQYIQVRGERARALHAPG